MNENQKVQTDKNNHEGTALGSETNLQSIEKTHTSKEPITKNKNRSKFFLFTILTYLILLVWAYYLQPNEYSIAIVGTNDLHGQAFPTILLKNDTKQQYKYGGLVYLANMIQTLTKQYNGNIIYLDGGDQFQGGVEASRLVSSGNIMNDFFKIAGLKGSSIGNHQFDFGPKFLISYLKNKQSPNIVANLKSEKGQSNFLPNHKSSIMIKLPNGIKVGVIGLATLQTLYSTAGFTSNLFPAYQILPYKEIILKQSKILRDLGANAVLLVSHIGDACNSDKTNTFHYIDSKVQDCPPDQITKIINQLPEGTLDGIVQGHRHSFAHRYHKGVPYMGSINGGYYFNAMYLKFDKYGRLKNSSIEGPIPVCQKIFQNIGRCNYLSQKQIKNSGKLVNWKFHNQEVVAHKQLSELFTRKYSEKMKPYFQELVKNQIHLYRKSNQEYELANLFTDLLAQSCQNINVVPDFSWINTGAFRTEWTPGVVQYQHFYNMFPFDNLIQVFEITGQSLIDTMKIVQSGPRIMNAWNLQQEIQINLQNNKNRLLSIRFGNGSQIQPEAIYTGVSLSYLIEGGDQFHGTVKDIFKPKNIKTIGQFRQVLKPYLKKVGIIKRDALINSKNPRIIIKYINSNQKQNKNKEEPKK